MLFALGAFAQSDITAHFSPFLIDVTQAVPAEVTITLPNADGETITTTVPLTVSVNLRVNVSGPQIANVVALNSITPTIHIVEDGSATDELGLPYELLPGDENLSLTDWVTFSNEHDRFAFAGEVLNITTAEELSIIDIVVHLYRPDGRLISVDTAVAGSRLVRPNESVRFDGSSPIPADQVGSYEIEIQGSNWRPYEP